MDPAKHVSKNKETGMYCVYDKKGKKVKEFEDKKDAVAYATKNHDDLMKEGTWHIPDSPKLKSGLKKLMSKPIKLGKEGDDATNKIGKFIGDDELYDDLYVAGKKNPNGDARDVIKKAMKRLRIKEEVNEAINHADAHTDAQQHSNGSMSVKKIPSMIKKPGDKHLHLHMKSYHKEKDGQSFAKKHGYKVSNYVKTPSGTRMDIHKEEVNEAKVYSKPAKLPRAVAFNPKVRAAQKAHAKGDWDGNVDKEGNAIVHINSKPYTVTKQESVNTADRKPETYRKSDGKMGTRMVPTHKDVVKEGTEVGETKWAAVNMFAGGDKFGGRGVQITGLNGQGKANMELLRQKGAYMQMPAKELPKLIKLLQQALKMTRDTKNEEVELDEGMTPAQKAAHDKAVAAFKARGGKVTKLPPGKAAGYHGKDDPGHGVHGMLSKPDSKKFNTKKKVKSMTADTQKESTETKTFFDIRKAATLEVNQLDEYMGGGGMSGFQGQANRNKYGEHGANPHHHMDHAKAAFKSGMKSKSAIIKHVQKKTGQKIHPDVHKAIHNTSGLSD